MNCTNDREERRKQKEILKKLYENYDAKHHDVYVIRFNKDIDKQKLYQYMVNRQLI